MDPTLGELVNDSEVIISFLRRTDQGKFIAWIEDQ